MYHSFLGSGIIRIIGDGFFFFFKPSRTLKNVRTLYIFLDIHVSQPRILSTFVRQFCSIFLSNSIWKFGNFLRQCGLTIHYLRATGATDLQKLTFQVHPTIICVIKITHAKRQRLCFLGNRSVHIMFVFRR